MKKDESKILIIYTGGTIGMIQDPNKKTLKPFDFNEITCEVPELNRIECEIDTISFKNAIDSSNVNTAIWEKIGDYIFENYGNYDGFVVLHGTDTMSYTASALSFMFTGLDKPIVFTGSQLPIGVVRTDGKENLITAIEIAAHKENSKSLVNEVVIYFEYQLFRANRTSKISSDHFDAFKSYNYPALAEAGIDIDFNKSALLKSSDKPFIYQKGFKSSVGILFFFPGIEINQIKHILNNPDFKVVILKTYGSGNLPLNKELIECLTQQMDKKIFLNVSQCKAGRVEQYKYETGKQLLEAGVVGVRDMTFEAVLAKSMFLLDKYPNDRIKFIQQFLTDFSGEFSE
jgi:L-asparaginase